MNQRYSQETTKYGESQRRLRIFCYLAGALIIVILLVLHLLPPAAQFPDFNTQTKESTLEEALVTVRRIPGVDPISVGLSVAQVSYPATGGAAKPNAVILIPKDDWQAGILAGRLSGPPVNGPILPIPSERLPDQVKKELRRLNPAGVPADAQAQVILCGDFSPSIAEKIQSELEMQVRNLAADSPEELAERIDHYLAVLTGDHPSEILIVPLESPEYAIPGAYWAARSGHSVLFAETDSIPSATKRALDLRPGGAYTYILAPEEIISGEAAGLLGNFGPTHRIPGSDPASFSVQFARYLDLGEQTRWWVDATPLVVGWGISDPGRTLTFADPEHPVKAVTASAMAHRANGGPLIWLNDGSVSAEAAAMLKDIRPTAQCHINKRLNKGWIVGDIISTDLLVQLDELMKHRKGGN